MMGVTPNPKLTGVDLLLKECAADLGRADTFKPSEVGVYFGDPGKTVPDPYFGGKGPDRTGCNFCGGCMVGCRFGAKNTLDKNYLFFAEKAGTIIFPETTVTQIVPLNGAGTTDGYAIHTRHTTGWGPFAERRVFRARKVILAAGVLGTLRLLFHCKEIAKTLPWLSRCLGEQIRTNSEALLGSSCKDVPAEPFSTGIAITSIFHADPHTHVEPVRYSPGSSFMRLLAVPMIDGDHPILRPLRLLFSLLIHPLRYLRLLFAPKWAERTIIFLVMQTIDSTMRFKWGRGLFTLFRRDLVAADNSDGTSRKIQVFNPLGHQIARAFAKRTNGLPQNGINEVILGIPSTAHILGGCAIGKDAAHVVIDVNHEVFGYPGMYVCDGSA
ncbi:MAG: GMC oxidoreductase, partial [Bdellovibrionota bacterium]